MVANFGMLTILFYSNKFLKLKYIHIFFSKISNEKITVRLMGWCVLWAGKYGNLCARALPFKTADLQD